MIKSVIFDWGGVLIDHIHEDVLRYCALKLNQPYSIIRENYYSFNEQFGSGKISENQLWKKICSKIKIPKPNNTSLWYIGFEKNYSPKKKVFDLAKKLNKKGYKIALLSNTEEPGAKFFKDQQYHFFKQTIFSCEEGVLKPNKKIYEIALKKLSQSPVETVFIDDLEENIKASNKLGINSILFKNYKQLENDLKKLKVF